MQKIVTQNTETAAEYRKNLILAYCWFEQEQPGIALMLRNGEKNDDSPAGRQLKRYREQCGDMIVPALYACAHAAETSFAYSYFKDYLTDTADKSYQGNSTMTEVLVDTMAEILGPRHVVSQVLTGELVATKEFLATRDRFHQAAMSDSGKRDARAELVFLTLAEAVQWEKEHLAEVESPTIKFV